MPELETSREQEIGQLGTFRAHIKNLQDELRGKDGTVVSIDCAELTTEDHQFWLEYLRGLKAAMDVIQALVNDNNPENQARLEVLILELKKGALVRVPAEQQRLAKDAPGRSHFYAWLANRFSFALSLSACKRWIERGDATKWTSHAPKMIADLTEEYEKMKL